ncbi:MAG: glycosyltransferase family 2 protein [Bacteroidales bacterium]|nr:glycosyltransferase family 2 protein [Bacteroidales bacterium]
MQLSIVSPVYHGEKMVEQLVERISKSVSTITPDYEIILVNDASPDNSWLKIKELCANNNRVKGINLSRNFGQHYAISAGLSLCSGEWIVVMDCDLQDRPEEIPHLYNKAQEGFDIVYARRVVRHDGFFKRISSKIFHSVFDWLSGIKTDSSISNFGVYNKIVIDEYNKMGEVARSFDSLIKYLGFNTAAVDVQHDSRGEGKSSYTFKKLISLSFDVMISNTNKPLKMAIGFGFFMSFISFCLAVFNVIAKYVGNIGVEGYTSTVFSIWFVGGILLMMLGILGLYVGKIFDQVKQRPIFVIREKLNF